ncbi:MAG: hypothetical protein NTX53_07985 [candidate division WOR-3 bacterium]|nr:hypothetical protein [candidate division WOR-3 bacterium]
MKIDGMEWMDWLHNMRAKEEEKRMREGISGAEWLRRVSAHAQAVLAGLPEHEQTPVARDKPATKPPRRRTRKP